MRAYENNSKVLEPGIPFPSDQQFFSTAVNLLGYFLVVWVRFMQHLQVWEYLEKQDALSAGPDFLGAVGILHATTHERADFNSRR